MNRIPNSHRFELTGDWRERAACRDASDPEIFDLPVKGENGEEYQRARGLCLSCPVSRQCYAWAKADRSYEGIAGGYVWFGSPRKGGRRSVVPC